MKRIFAVGVAVMLAAAACGGDTDTTPRAFDTPVTGDVSTLMDDAVALAEEANQLLQPPNGDAVMATLSKVRAGLKRADLSSKVEARALELVDRFEADLADYLGDEALQRFAATSQQIVDYLGNAADAEILTDTLELVRTLSSDIAKFDPDIGSAAQTTYDRIYLLLRKAGAGDQVAQLQIWFDEMTKDLRSYTLEAPREVLDPRLADAIQRVLDRILP